MSSARPASRWHFLVTPKWLGWHAFVACSVVGMLWLGDWQLRRAEAGNALSWAYTFEWPVFALFAVVFWVKTIIDEARPPEAAGEPSLVDLPAGAALPEGGGSAGDRQADAAGDRQADAAGDQQADEDAELAAYNAYLAKLNEQVQGHGRWHGLR
jgi:hypothetical protein